MEIKQIKQKWNEEKIVSCIKKSIGDFEGFANAEEGVKDVFLREG